MLRRRTSSKSGGGDEDFNERELFEIIEEIDCDVEVVLGITSEEVMNGKGHASGSEEKEAEKEKKEKVTEKVVTEDIKGEVEKTVSGTFDFKSRLFLLDPSAKSASIR